MGIHKSSETKKASSPARKHKLLSTLRKSAFVARNIVSGHFLPPATATAPAPAPATLTSTATAAGGVNTIKGGEARDEQLLIDGRKAGVTITEPSKDLPSRSPMCLLRKDGVPCSNFEAKIPVLNGTRCSLPRRQEHSIGSKNGRTGRTELPLNVAVRARLGQVLARSYILVV